ncbi:MAG: DUF1192 domain-containing protein [Alphaproteobacteria bacterium]
MPAFDPDDLPRNAKPPPKPLDPMGIEELNAYIAELEAEIARVRVEIAAKEKRKNAAEAFFKR